MVSSWLGCRSELRLQDARFKTMVIGFQGGILHSSGLRFRA